MQIRFERGKSKDGDGFSWNTALEVEAAKHIKFIQKFVGVLAKNPNQGGNLSKWFGSADRVAIGHMLTNLNKYLNERCTSITLVSTPGSSFGAIWYEPTTFGFEDDEGYSEKMWGSSVKTNSKSDFQKPGGYLLLSTGIRIQVSGAYYDPPEKNGNDGLDQMDTGRINTIFHEITHRVLQTVDAPKGKCYGYNNVRNLALTNPAQALQNADNWGYFLADYYKNCNAFK